MGEKMFAGIKRTKIVATLGPASNSEDSIRQLIAAGVNTFRLNFSHGTHEEHGRMIELIQKIRKELAEPVAILQDLSGPKIRIGIISDPPLQLNVGDQLILNTSITQSEGSEIPVSYPRFAEDVTEGAHLLLADGNIELIVEKVSPPKVFCKVMAGGKLTSKKGINYPGGSFQIPALTDKDKDDLKFGLASGVDLVALSFVKSVDDINLLKEIFHSENKSVPIIAKIEKHEALGNYPAILEAVDGIMVARGDLGIEIPPEQIPVVQKKIIRLANLQGKPVITATQMLLSMVNSPRPTRAEITDVANAILDGTDAVMLSEETAVGKYPVITVKMMYRIARETEKNYPFQNPFIQDIKAEHFSVSHAISESATHLAKEIDAKVIICPTTSGLTASLIARYRPRAVILALTPDLKVYYQLALLWNVVPVCSPVAADAAKLMENALGEALKRELIKKGDTYVITAGFPFGQGAPTNLIKAGVYE